MLSLPIPLLSWDGPQSPEGRLTEHSQGRLWGRLSWAEESQEDFHTIDYQAVLLWPGQVVALSPGPGPTWAMLVGREGQGTLSLGVVESSLACSCTSDSPSFLPRLERPLG